MWRTSQRQAERRWATRQSDGKSDTKKDVVDDRMWLGAWNCGKMGVEGTLFEWLTDYVREMGIESESYKRRNEM